MSGLAAVHLEPASKRPRPRQPRVGGADRSPPIENTRKSGSLPIAASCGAEPGNIMLPLGISPLYVVSKRPRPAPSQDAPPATQQGANRTRGDDTIMTVG